MGRSFTRHHFKSIKEKLNRFIMSLSTHKLQKVPEIEGTSRIKKDQQLYISRDRTRASDSRFDELQTDLREAGHRNIETLTGKYIELGKILQKRKINIACVQETRWKGTKARDVDGFKLWYSGSTRGKNGVGILVDKDLRELVVEVRRVNDRLMSIKLVVGGFTVNVISAYAPQKLFIGGDFNGHIGASVGGFDDVRGGYGFGDRNEGGNSLLEFARAFDLVIANSSFPKREVHLVTFRNLMGRTQIDYLLCRKCDKGLCTTARSS
ncbi:PREDICTED: craniofacial development protein 2-like [Nicotiana attenuata]|uniref:craniofacial development protein 2-like n=1 Tax=Nicotiana attenuata TaxID=49451 RepID=UPI000905A48B|nr:PREDICTED: craniofacial development protein 2-like [Nicotiana attenuata]